MTEPTCEDPKAVKDVSYVLIPFIVLFGLGIVAIVIMMIGTFFLMADWIPPISDANGRYYGAEALSEVYFKWLVRGLLVTWPFLTVAAIFAEKDSRKDAAKA